MKRIASASQWLRQFPERRPAPESFVLSSKDSGDVVAVSTTGAILRRAA